MTKPNCFHRVRVRVGYRHYMLFRLNKKTRSDVQSPQREEKGQEDDRPRAVGAAAVPRGNREVQRRDPQVVPPTTQDRQIDGAPLFGAN